MSEPDHDRQLGELIKSEADELLFDDLHFDARLKEQVRYKISEERTGPVSQARKEDKIRFRWSKSWLYGVSAAIIAAIVITTVIWQPADNDEIVAGDPPNLIMGGIENAPIPGTAGWTGGDLGTMAAMDPVIVFFVEEADLLYGEKVNVPTYMIEHYDFREFRAYDITDGRAAKIAIVYEEDLSRQYIVTESKTEIEKVYDEYDMIDLNGMQVYVHQEWDTSNVELRWSSDRRYYSIAGPIGVEEAVKIAESMSK